MALSTDTITTISCDGIDAEGCPDNVSVSYHMNARPAAARALREGWAGDGLDLCPRCCGVPVSTMSNGSHLPPISLEAPRGMMLESLLRQLNSGTKLQGV